MDKYIIKQRINNTSIPPTIYDEDDDNIGICIVQKDGKFGVVTEADNVLLDFAYDNISMAGFNLYLLIQNAKMGILHIRRTDDNAAQGFKIVKVIPCVYDLITFPKNGESFVFLRKDSEKASSVQIYYTHTNIISEPYWRVEYDDRDYIVVTDLGSQAEKIFDNQGTNLFAATDKECMLCNVYETCGGTVFTKVSGDKASLVLVKKRRKKQYEQYADLDDDICFELTGEIEEFCCDGFRPILANEHTRTFERAYALGFIVEAEGRYQVLDGNCVGVCVEYLDDVSVRTSIQFGNTEITLGKAGILLEESTNEYAKGYTHFTVTAKDEQNE